MAEALPAGCGGLAWRNRFTGISKLLWSLADSAAAGGFPAATRCQEWLIRLYHGVCGARPENVWHGRKYALCRLGLTVTLLTLIQNLYFPTPAAARRIDHCLAEFREPLD